MSSREIVKSSAEAVARVLGQEGGYTGPNGWGSKACSSCTHGQGEVSEQSPATDPLSREMCVSCPASARRCTGKKPSRATASYAQSKEKGWLRIWVNIFLFGYIFFLQHCSPKLSNNDIKTTGEYSTLKTAHEAFHRPHKKRANGWAITKWKYHNKPCLGPRQTPSAKGLRTNPNSGDPHKFNLKKKEFLLPPQRCPSSDLGAFSFS